MKRILTKKVTIGVVVLGAVAVIAGVLGTRPVSSQPADVTWLHDYALRWARSMGEPNPTMEYAPTDDAGALAAIGRAGDTPGNPKTPVYVVVLRGKFTYTKGFAPPGFPVQTGTTLVLEVVVSTHGTLGLTLSDNPSVVDTAAIGPMSTFSQ
jgi:hypothetical protein